MKYKDLISLDENFQYSINLQFDINDISKIKNYIPTKDACTLLKDYFNSILDGKNRSTVLVGPYGKGKSHLLLVLITLLDNYDSKNENAIEELIKKIGAVDKELYDLIIVVRKKRIKLMPVIVNSNYNNLNQAFLLAISEALEREGFANIVISTYFNSALEVISKWEKDYKDVVDDLKKCLEEYNYSLKELKMGLRNYSEEHYNIFKNVYSCLLHGQEFNPLVNSDIIKIFKDVSYKLKEYEFSGIFIAFDEFSKFLEYTDNSHIAKDLKLLQDFAELANRTGSEEQIHLSCITHKAIGQYANALSEERNNAVKAVEGRFKLLYFNRSLEQNYEIISYAIKKKEGFANYFTNYYLNNEKFYSNINSNYVFKNVENIKELLFKGCFPLNPITTYSLIELSEKIAQNERTLFTFLTDDDPNGLKYFIENNATGLVDLDKVYDYFNPILKKEKNGNIKNVWIKAESSLMKINSKIEKKIIKSVAVIYMIDYTELLIPNDLTIKSSISLDDKNYYEALNSLIGKGILKRKKIIEEIDFSNIYNKELVKQIEILNGSQFYNINLRETLDEIVPKSYTLPRKYNDNYKITRFFQNVFMTEKELVSLTSFDIFFESNYCDGLIINLIKESSNNQKIIDHFSKINDDLVVLKIPKNCFPKNILSLLKDYKSIKFLQDENTFQDEFSDELELIMKETNNVILDKIYNYFSNENLLGYLYKKHLEKKNLNVSSYLSDICMKVYNKTPIINNEMINKRDLSIPIKKARNAVIDTLLNNDDSLIKSKTSAAATIYKAIVAKKNEPSIKKIVKLINNFVATSENNKISFEKIYEKLENKPYSMRKGVLPIFIAMALYNYSDIIVLYFMSREIELSANSLIKINENPSKYYIYTEKGTAEKNKYLSNLMDVFNVSNLETQQIGLKKLIVQMRQWVLSMPKLLREYDLKHNYMNLKKEYILVKSKLLLADINNNEFIYKTLLEIFNADDYSYVVSEMKKMKVIFDQFMSNYTNYLIIKTKEAFDSSFKGSLNTLLKEWYKNNHLDESHQLYNLKTRKLLKYIEDLSTYNDNDIIENLSRIITGFYIEDWKPSEVTIYIETLNNIISSVDNSEKDDNSNRVLLLDSDDTVEKYFHFNEDISVIGSTMKNNIEEVIKEYGDSLTEKEKITILISIIKNYV